ncbi:hypothetical protein Nmel_008568 [Mimus melanotis]
MVLLQGYLSSWVFWGYSVGKTTYNWLLSQPRFIGFPYSQFEISYEQMPSPQAHIARSMLESLLLTF